MNANSIIKFLRGFNSFIWRAFGLANSSTHALKRHTLRNLLGFLTVATILGSLATANATPVYRFFDLGTLGGTTSFASSINNAATIVGSSYTLGNGPYVGLNEQHATVWAGGSILDLNTSATTISNAVGINDAGVVVGTTTVIGGNWVSQGTVWNGISSIFLGTLGGTSSKITMTNDFS